MTCVTGFFGFFSLCLSVSSVFIVFIKQLAVIFLFSIGVNVFVEFKKWVGELGRIFCVVHNCGAFRGCTHTVVLYVHVIVLTAVH